MKSATAAARLSTSPSLKANRFRIRMSLLCSADADLSRQHVFERKREDGPERTVEDGQVEPSHQWSAFVDLDLEPDRGRLAVHVQDRRAAEDRGPGCDIDRAARHGS